MITTVILDLGDTLYDEIDFCRSGFHAAAEHVARLSDSYSADEVFAAMWQSFITGDCGSTFNVALAAVGISYDDSLIGKLVEIYRTHMPTLTLPPESRSTLESLKSSYTLGLLTIQLLRPSGLYRQPSPLPEAAPKLKIDALGDLPDILAGDVACP